MSKKYINLFEENNLPYSTAVYHNKTYYLSGIVSEDLFEDSVLHGDIRFESRKAFENLLYIIRKLDRTLEDIIKIDIFLKTMDDFNGMNEVYREIFFEPFPARTTVAVAGIYDDLRIELSAVVSGE